jgi:hypothetical protein
MKFARILVLLSWFLGGNLLAGSITAELDRTTGVEGDQFTLTFRVQGSHDAEPVIPEIPNLEVAGAGTSTNVSIINGTYSKETGYSFTLFPQKAGTYNIPSVTLKVDGENVSTLPLTIHVEAVAKGQQAEEAGEPIFIKREFSNPNPYVGESLVETIRIYHKVRIEQASPTSANSPDFRYFPVEGESHGRQQVGNDIFEVITVSKVIVPLSAGEKVVPPFALDAVIVVSSPRTRRSDPFWDMFGGQSGQRVRKLVSSAEGLLTVKPIPEGGNRPADFKGIVGHFQIQADLNKRQLKVGETTTLTMTISGQGILDRIKEPELNLGDKIKIYADKPEVKEQATADRGVLSEKVFKFALVPTAPGSIDLSEFKLSVFDPTQQAFVTLSAPLGTIIVEGTEAEKVVVVSGNGDSPSTANKAGVKSLANDLLDLHRHIDIHEVQELSSRDASPLVLIGAVPGSLAFLGLGFQSWRRRNRGDESTQRRSRAYRNFKAAIQAGGTGSEDSLMAVYDAYRILLGDKLGLQGKALTLKEIKETLAKKPLTAELRNDAVALAEEMERIIYSGKTAAGDDAQRIRQKVMKLAGEVDRQC